jgi:two-component system sensor histidine kinase KdpD
VNYRSYIWSVVGIASVVAALAPFHERINATTVALALLLVVLFVATLWGSRPALVASVLGMLSFNFFFLPPLHTFTIAAPQNWVALTAFFITAITAGQLSARAHRRAEEAEAGRREIERLYQELREAFARASHAEALRQSERLKSALLDAVTHDLRTPLTSIKASVTTLLTTNDEPEESVALDAEGRQELLEVIDEEADRLNHFVEGLVELARIEAGALSLRRRWGAVEELIAAALKRAEALTRAHRVVTEIEKELPSVRVDARALSEVIYTLVDNAVKYAPAGTLIRVGARHADDETVEISVADEGRGIPVELRERVFDKFFRATQEANGNAQNPTGTGMGLAIARGIVEAHGGRIWIEAGGDGRGARVGFKVPVGDEEVSEQSSVDAERDAGAYLQ